MQPTPLSLITLDGREFLVKRDDLIDPYLAGNKYRKLYTLLQTPKEKYKKIISYGGTQSNAMLAIAAVCKQKGWEFLYYTKPLNAQIENAREGNYAKAITLGMQHVTIAHELYKDYIASLALLQDPDVLIIDQGGASTDAQLGIEVLAQEILSQQTILQKHGVSALATPSATGTSALFLAKALPQYKIYTTPSVGDAAYLRTQMLALSDELPVNLHILQPQKKYHFGKPHEACQT